VLDLAQPRRDDDGDFAGYIGTTFDITERKEQEAALVESNRTVREHSRELNLLYELKSDLQVCREVGETLPVLARYLGRMFGERELGILLYNNSRDLVEPFLALGRAAAPSAFSPDRCWALRKGRSHYEESTPFGPICPNAAGWGGDGALCLPMTAFGDCVGVMQFALGTGAAPAAVEALQRSGQRIADEIAAAIEELKLRAAASPVGARSFDAALQPALLHRVAGARDQPRRAGTRRVRRPYARS
jgi:K+-sensing histidine kinase KdpD